jgi:hypothetical protein
MAGRPRVSTTTRRIYDNLPEIYRTLDRQEQDYPLLRYLSTIGDLAGAVETIAERIDFLTADEQAGTDTVLANPITPPVYEPPAGMVQWYRADDLAGMDDGQPVTVWPDASGNGLDLSQATTSKQPSFDSMALNGRPSVVFQRAASQYLERSSSLGNLLSGATGWTVLAVMEATTVTDTATVWFAGTGTGTTRGRLGFTAANLATPAARRMDSDSLVSIVAPAGTAVPLGQFYIAEQAVSYEQALGYAWKDGTLIAGPAALGTPGTATLTASSTTRLGAATSGSYFDGAICEVLVYDRLLTDSERGDAQAYLADKYGIVGPDTGLDSIVTTTSDLADPVRADPEWLPWLAQLIGVRVASLAVADQRDAIAGAVGGWQAGTRAGLIGAARSALTGSRSVTLFDHYLGSPWQIGVSTVEAETSSPANVLAAITASHAKPAGFRVIHTYYSAPWDLLETRYPTWADIEAAGSWQRIEGTF